MKTIDPMHQEAFLRLALDLQTLFPQINQAETISLSEKIFDGHVKDLRAALDKNQKDLLASLNESETLKAKLTKAVDMSVKTLDEYERKTDERTKSLTEGRKQFAIAKKAFKDLLK